MENLATLGLELNKAPALKIFELKWLIIGVVIGTYSSIYVASNVILYMKVTREDLMIPVKEGADLEGTV